MHIDMQTACRSHDLCENTEWSHGHFGQFVPNSLPLTNYRSWVLEKSVAVHLCGTRSNLWNRGMDVDTSKSRVMWMHGMFPWSLRTLYPKQFALNPLQKLSLGKSAGNHLIGAKSNLWNKRMGVDTKSQPRTAVSHPSRRPSMSARDFSSQNHKI